MRLKDKVAIVVGAGQSPGEGMGNGRATALRFAQEGAKVTACDISADAIDRAKKEFGVSIVSPEAIYDVACDIFSPGALGAVINPQTIPRLKCKVVAGAANNQLADDRVADMLAAKGVLWAPDFVVNAGGLINISEELGGYDPAAARRRVRGIADTLRQVFDVAESMAATPLTAALELARRRLAAATS